MTPRGKLGVKLRALRVKASLTQLEIADALGYTTPQLVSNWERGVCPPPLASLVRLSSLLDVRPSELVNMVCDTHIADLEAERRELLERVKTATTTRRRRA